LTHWIWIQALLHAQIYAYSNSAIHVQPDLGDFAVQSSPIPLKASSIKAALSLFGDGFGIYQIIGAQFGFFQEPQALEAGFV
jgi:hypothetical protein